MRKVKKIWIKQEKRIVNLIYKKGLMPKEFKILEELYWAEYHNSLKTYKSKEKKYRFAEYYPEVHYSSTDYFGECDEHSLVKHIFEYMYWDNIINEEEIPEDGFPKSNFRIKNRNSFIKYLQNLKTVNSDNKINKITKRIVRY